jgi:hypothetical protein
VFKLDFKAIRSKTAAKFTRKRNLFMVELAGGAAVLAGIAHYNWPAALAAGGLAAIVAVERQPNV